MTKDVLDPDLEDPRESQFLLARGWRCLRNWVSRLDLGNQIIIYRVDEDEDEQEAPVTSSESQDCLYQDAHTPPPP